jgi:hypothetical protein
MDYEQFTAEAIAATDQADVAALASQQAATSGRFAEYFEQRAAEAIKRMEDGYNDSEIS